MTAQVDSFDIADRDASYDDYRAICAASVSSLFFGLLSVFAFLNILLGLIPILGIMLGVFALVQIRQRPRELTGRGLAWAGISLSVTLLLASWVVMTIVYLTEVPEGYSRIRYSQLQPEEGRLGQLVPPLAEQLDGRSVFIKGYIFPSKQKRGIREFLLVRDKGDCCFGGNPKLTDRIQVKLAGQQRLSFSSRLHKVAGTFRLKIDGGRAVDAGGGVYYFLEDAQLR